MRRGAIGVIGITASPHFPFSFARRGARAGAFADTTFGGGKLPMRIYLRKSAGLFAAALIFFGADAATTASRAQQMVSVSRDETNVRTGPGTRFSATWSLMRGFPLRVIARRGLWLNVIDFEGDRGWVFRPLVGLTPHHIVAAKAATLRARPSTRSRMLGTLAYGDILRTLGAHAGWVRVRAARGKTGWVARRLLWGW